MVVRNNTLQYGVTFHSGSPVGHYRPGDTVSGVGTVKNTGQVDLQLECKDRVAIWWTINRFEDH